MKVSIKTLGCKVNTYESEFMSYLFRNNGYVVTEDDDADIFVVNTCTVTNTSDSKSRKVIRSIRKNNKNAIIIVTGCYTQKLTEQELKAIDANIILGNKDKSKIIDHLNKYLETKNKEVYISDLTNEDFEDMCLDEFKGQTRGFIKVEDGCNNFCSYCIIPYVRGRVRSKNKETVIKEINSLVDNECKEVVLTGIHTGQYNDNGINLFNLMSSIINETNLYRLRLSSIEIVELNDDILSLFKNNNRISNHFHIPLQAGSDRILKSMNRRYDTNYFMGRVNAIRKCNPNVSLTTDVIVGFPGETDEEFNETYEFCKKVNFSKIHVFPYSDREGTVASKMENHVKDSVKKERVKRLLELSNELEIKYNKSMLGNIEEIITEEYKNGYTIGHTSNFIRVLVNIPLEHNKIYKVKLCEIKGLDVIGEIVNE